MDTQYTVNNLSVEDRLLMMKLSVRDKKTKNKALLITFMHSVNFGRGML